MSRNGCGIIGVPDLNLNPFLVGWLVGVWSLEVWERPRDTNDLNGLT